MDKLEKRVNKLETRFPKESWIFGESFIKRAFAIWGYAISAYLMVLVVFGVLGLVIGLLSGF